MVFLETPTNPFLKTVPIQYVCECVRSKNPNAIVVVDNTWATPLFQHPLEHGADISLHSGTKYFSGHSDVMNGMLLTNRIDLADELRALRFYGGAILAPESAWMARRSLQTLDIRMKRHSLTTRAMVQFLQTLPQVRRVYFPHVDGHQLIDYGGIVFFELRHDLVDQYQTLISNLELFQTGTGMACVTSMIAQPYSGSHASMSDSEKQEMGLGPELVRLSFGMEEPDDLTQDLIQAFDKLETQ